jgi:two-component system sensor histidine kinase CpxA
MRLVESASGVTYRVVFWSPRSRSERIGVGPEVLVGRGAVVVLVSAAVCYVLARSLTSPIPKVRAATHEIASGNLAARVGGTVAGRNDEIAGLGRDFDRMAERVEALVTAQQRLLGDISHELRSPLARLGVALDLAKQRGGANVGDLLGRIELEADRLDELVGELLVLNRLEGGAEIVRADVDLADLVRDIADDADFEAQSMGRAVHVTAAEPCVVEGDRDLLRRAIENVTRNAVRYTAEETTVELSVAAENGEGVVRVRDHGPGVPPEELPHLFRPFYRVAGARDRTSGGVGLGLAITERAVARHGGTASAANAEGGGLLVEIRLPLARPPAAR